MSSNNVGVIFILFGPDKVLESRQVYTQGMNVPENAVGHRFLVSRAGTNLSGRTAPGPATYYGELTDINEFKAEREEFRNVDTSDFQGVITRGNLFVAVKKSDTVISRKPSSL